MKRDTGFGKRELHHGFRILQKIAKYLPQGAFVFTSNVDGQFQKAGFPENRIYECHGSIHWLQCVHNCQYDISPATGFNPVVDETLCRLQSRLPRCAFCGGTCRPNILMFDDWNWLDDRSAAQCERMRAWTCDVKRLVVIEIGAGRHISTVRRGGESQKGALIRINPHDPALPSEKEGLSLPMGGLEALQGIEAALHHSGFFGH